MPKLPRLHDVMYNPSGLDSRSNYLGDDLEEQADWGVLMCQTRDSDVLTESNWHVALTELGGESEDVQILRFGHWACGWLEYMVVNPDCSLYDRALELYEEIQDYPILDECDFSERESEAADQVWLDCFSNSERVEYIRAHLQDFEFRSRADLFACARGKWFGGYASDLV